MSASNDAPNPATELTDMTTRCRTVWSPAGWVTFDWRPDPGCSICGGVGSAWQHRTYGDRQYHGEYFEDCARCSAPTAPK